ncbi:MAG: response regulator [Phycisphaerae bacterium]|nr:response regulator [Phycisphaerae bacterium]MCZ2398450.1 response regulator [Phycisphaerae bacterium]NUQ50741.1 response regulator [Phycisphaerae bacterium]
MDSGSENGHGTAAKSVFTTGEVADICKISQQTVIRCFDSGKLRGFRVPGSRFRRIPRESLIQFMKDNNIPLKQLETGRKRVLVVDDDPAIVEMLVELLERDGRFEVQTASDGFQAGLRTQEFRPDVIVLDYLLPGLNGDAVIERIRSEATLQSVRIIVVSGVVKPQDVQRLLDAGANDFLQKPFEIESLVERITEMACA